MKMALPLAIMVVLAGCSRIEKEAPKPTLANQIADKYIWDFGKVKEKESVKHTFVFRNDSQHELNILNVTTSCGCTVSKVEKKKLAPGEATNIEVKFNSKGYSGIVQQFVYVNTDDPKEPFSRLGIKAEVVK